MGLLLRVKISPQPLVMFKQRVRHGCGHQAVAALSRGMECLPLRASVVSAHSAGLNSLMLHGAGPYAGLLGTARQLRHPCLFC